MGHESGRTRPHLPLATSTGLWPARLKMPPTRRCYSRKREAPVVTGLWPVWPPNRGKVHAKHAKHYKFCGTEDARPRRDIPAPHSALGAPCSALVPTPHSLLITRHSLLSAPCSLLTCSLFRIIRLDPHFGMS